MSATLNSTGGGHLIWVKILGCSLWSRSRAGLRVIEAYKATGTGWVFSGVQGDAPVVGGLGTKSPRSLSLFVNRYTNYDVLENEYTKNTAVLQCLLKCNLGIFDGRIFSRAYKA